MTDQKYKSAVEELHSACDLVSHYRAGPSGMKKKEHESREKAESRLEAACKNLRLLGGVPSEEVAGKNYLISSDELSRSRPFPGGQKFLITGNAGSANRPPINPNPKAF